MRLPYPPSINHYYCRAKNGRLYLGAAGNAFRLETLWAIKQEKKRTGAPKYPITGLIEMTVYLYPPDRRLRDLDNGLKCLCDALQHAGAFRDDSQIVDLRVRKVLDDPKPPGFIEVSLAAL